MNNLSRLLCLPHEKKYWYLFQFSALGKATIESKKPRATYRQRSCCRFHIFRSQTLNKGNSSVAGSLWLVIKLFKDIYTEQRIWPLICIGEVKQQTN